MGRQHKWISGDNWCICDRCGFTFRRSEMRTEWTGQFVCAKNCWEVRHPQDFVRVEGEVVKAPDPIRPDQDVLEEVTTINDEDVTLTVGTDTVNQQFGDQLTADRTVTLSTTDASDGDQFIITKMTFDRFSVDVGPGLFTIQPQSGANLIMEFDGANWFIKRSSVI